jgi:hypothetical protein
MDNTTFDKENPNAVKNVKLILDEEVYALVNDMWSNFDSYFKGECIAGKSYANVKRGTEEDESAFENWKSDKFKEAYILFLQSELTRLT